MPEIAIFMNAEGMMKDWKEEGRDIHLQSKETARLGCLADGMKSGAPSISFGVPLDDGSVVFFETSLTILAGAVNAFTELYESRTSRDKETT